MELICTKCFDSKQSQKPKTNKEEHIYPTKLQKILIKQRKIITEIRTQTENMKTFCLCYLQSVWLVSCYSFSIWFLCVCSFKLLFFLFSAFFFCYFAFKLFYDRTLFLKNIFKQPSPCYHLTKIIRNTPAKQTFVWWRWQQTKRMRVKHKKMLKNQFTQLQPLLACQF